MGSLQGKPALSKNHKETLRMLWINPQPCYIYRLQGNPMMIIGFPRNLFQGFTTTKEHYEDPIMACQHLQCGVLTQWL